MSSQGEPVSDLFASFLANTPPGVEWDCSHLIRISSASNDPVLDYLPVELFCSGNCDEYRPHDSFGERLYLSDNKKTVSEIVRYHCRLCRLSPKSYSLLFKSSSGAWKTDCTVTKYGELPLFGPHVPAKLQRMIQPDRDAFMKGRRAEAHGLGIGAFAYYRRVVENQKDRLLSEIIRVGQQIGASNDTIELLENAKTERQFSAAVEKVKDAVPEVLKIRGHNPFTLLHSALSKGIHNQSDEECLAIATDIRVVLTAFAEKISTAINDDNELNAAVARLMNPKT